jgi:predicted nucleic acid-binding protein
VTPVLLDTGFIVALLDRSERHHQRCKAALRSLRGALLTCEAVIAEACYLLREQASASDAILENVERGAFLIPFRLDESAPGVRALMKRYARVPMDFADACLVSLADTLGTGRILSLAEDAGVRGSGGHRDARAPLTPRPLRPPDTEEGRHEPRLGAGAKAR